MSENSNNILNRDETDMTRIKLGESKISDYNVELAYHLINDAIQGRLSHFERKPRSLKFYKVFLSFSFRLVRYVAHISLLLMFIFDFASKDRNSTKSKIILVIEVITILFYFVQLMIVMHYSVFVIFIRDKKYYITFVSILGTLLDICLFMTGVSDVRFSLAFRVLLFINSPEQQQIRRHLRTLKLTFFNTLVILPFLFTFCFMMVAFMYKFFNSNNVKYYNGKAYMKGLDEVIWEIIVFITSANSPDVILPGFANNWGVGLLFLIFYAVIYFLLIFIYGLIMAKFRNNTRTEMQQLIIGKISLINDAFNLLSIKNAERDEIINLETWYRLMSHFPKYSNKPKSAEVLLKILSNSSECYLKKYEFIHIGDLLSAPLSDVSDELHFFEKYFWFGFSGYLTDFVEGKIFNIIIGLLIIANVLVITFTAEQYAELIFCIIFILEIFLRIYVKGVSRYFNSYWNKFDFCIIISAFIFWFINVFNKNKVSGVDQTITFTLLILRNLRLLKLLRGVNAYRQLLHIVGMLLPTFCSLLAIIFFFIVEYMCIGNWIFHDLFHNADGSLFQNYNNTCLTKQNSEFGRLHYCILSFDSFLGGFMTLCSIAIGNNWHVITEGYGVAVQSKFWSRIYFMVFKGAITYLLLLIVAFLLDMFLLGYSQKTGLRIEEKINKRLAELNVQFSSYHSIRNSRLRNVEESQNSCSNLFKRVQLIPSKYMLFRLKTKGIRSVDYVSQAMFQPEIEAEMKSNADYQHIFNY